MLTKSIIVSGISNLSDARYCSGMGVEYLGVCIDQDNPSFLPIERFNEINSWLSGINWILETESKDIAAILSACKTYEVAGVSTDSPEMMEQLQAHDINVLFKNDVFRHFSVQNGILGLVIEYPALETTLQFSSVVPIYVAGELTIEQLEEVRDNESIAGVILNGGVEERPGFKNMDDLIDALEIFED